MNSCVQTGFTWRSHRKENLSAASSLSQHLRSVKQHGFGNKGCKQMQFRLSCLATRYAWRIKKKKRKKKGSSIWWNGHLANCWVEIFWFGFAWQPAARERFHISENLWDKKSQAASWESKIQTFYKSVQKNPKSTVSFRTFYRDTGLILYVRPAIYYVIPIS